MGLISALNTSLNGLSLNEQAIDVIGNNIANANTNGFKSSNVLFQTQLLRTLSAGSGPSGQNAGTNPIQIGLGASTSTVRRDFTSGAISASTSPTDLAIQGQGFFVVSDGNDQLYSRSGNFTLNSERFLATPDGKFLQGYGVDDDFQLVKTQLTNLRVPIGEQSIAVETTEAEMSGAIRTSGTVATQGSLLLSEALTDVNTSSAITGGTALVDVRDPSNTALFTSGETLSFAPQKGGRTVEAGTLDVTGSTSVSDLLTFFDETLGIQSGGTIPNDGGTGTQPGVTVNGSGQIQILGNQGTVNEIAVPLGSLTSDGTTVQMPFPTQSQSADGESASTAFVVYDSLGQPLTVRFSTVVESTTATTSTVRYFVESGDSSSTDLALSNGTLQFDSAGELLTTTNPTISIPRANTPAQDVQFTLDVSKLTGVASSNDGSSLQLVSQNGAAPGLLTSFAVEGNGNITGIFDNGVTKTLGQVALARFANVNGLVEAGENTFRVGVNSGQALISGPGTNGLGTLLPGAIELSNTDVGRNLVDLIVASTNYRGNARVISSVNQLVDELLLLNR